MTHEDIDDVMARWHGRPSEARETVTRLERLAREAIRERDNLATELAAERGRADHWRAQSDAAQRELTRAGDRAAQANQELVAEREQSHRLAEALRAAFPMHHHKCNSSPRGEECDCWLRLRETALAEYEGA